VASRGKRGEIRGQKQAEAGVERSNGGRQKGRQELRDERR
jgi:hypothetical protein